MREDIRTTEVNICPLCGAFGYAIYSGLHDLRLQVRGTWSFLRCLECEFVWLNPRPLPEDLWVAYPLVETPTHVSGLVLKSRVKSLAIGTIAGYPHLLGGPFSRILGRVLTFVPSLPDMAHAWVMWLEGPRGGKLLDVGCSFGNFLMLMRELGWDVLGLEPHQEVAQIAEECVGVRVLPTSLETSGLPDESFDAVTASHVIEHVYDPVQFLQNCAKLLKPGGRLVVVTPNIHSLGHRIFRHRWFALEHPRHLYLFSALTLNMVAQRAGLRITMLRTTARAARWAFCLSKTTPHKIPAKDISPRYRGKLLLLQGLLFQALENALVPLWRNAGEEIVLIMDKEKQP